jgi:hypothetical protein
MPVSGTFETSAVNNNAPNGSGFAHCTDEWDVMCYKDDPSVTIRTVCTNRSHDQRLDCNHDDYYHTAPPNAGQQWVTLTWTSAQTLNAAEVYFFDDNGGVRLPASWTLQYWQLTGRVCDASRRCSPRSS